MSEWPIDWRAVVDEAVRRRKQEGLTQAALATLSGVSRPTVAAFEQGEINLRFERVIAILDSLGMFIQPGRSDSLQAFVHEARNRFRDLTAKLDEAHPSRQPHGYSEQAYAIEGVENPPTLTRLKEVLAHAPRTSGWTPFWVPTKESIKPAFHDGLLECWLGRPDADPVFNDPAHSDFWQVSRDGSAYLRRGYQEDGPDLDAGSFFDLTLPIWRTAEILVHAAWLAAEIGALGSDPIRFSGRYTGLAGRELISWAKPLLRLALDERHRARSDSVDLSALTSANEINGNLEHVVGTIVRPLYERFDGFDPSQDLIVGQVADFRRQLGRISESR
jgi:transcriptional regulator with XRE-family HTH domain